MELLFIRGSRGLVREILDSVRALVFGGILGGGALCINLLQMASLVLFPFSKKGFEKANLAFAYTYWKFCRILLEDIYQIRVVITGDSLPQGESVLLFCNHQQMPDILALMPLADRYGRLADMKWFAKDVIKYIPGIGWGMLFLHCIFLKRNWTADAHRVNATFSRLLSSGLPYWLISFSEGTRITEDKRQASQAFAKKSGLPVLENVLLPRPKGFAVAVEAFRGRADAVYDVTLGYLPGIPNLWQFLKGRLREVHIHVRRFPMSQLPQGEKELSSWLIARFVEKDHSMRAFRETGSFAQGGTSR